MRLIWHIISKDVRRYRWALLMYGLLFAAQVGFGLAVLGDNGADLEWVDNLRRANTALVALQFIMGYLLVTRFVQSDGLVGTRMFWVTRPISPTRLLAAKVLGVLLFFGLLPVLLLLPWWLYCDFSARDIFWTAIETLGWQLLMIAPAFLVATLTDDLGRVLMWTLLLVTGLLAGTIILQSKLGIMPVESDGTIYPGPIFVGLWLAGLVLVVGSITIAIHQFLTRRFVRSVVLIVPVMLLILLIGLVWPRNWVNIFDQINRPIPASADAFEGVQLAFESAHIRSTDTRAGKESTMIIQTFQVKGLPEELIFAGQVAKQSWRWPDGPAFDRRGISFGGWVSTKMPLQKMLSFSELQDDPETMRWQQERRDKENADLVARGLRPGYFIARFPPRPPMADGITMSGHTQLPNSVVTRIRTRQPAYEAQIQCLLSRPKIAFEMPLTPNTRRSGESQAMHILRVTRSENNWAALRVTETIPSLMINGIWFTMSADTRNTFYKPLLAVNRADGNYGSVGSEYKPTNAKIGGVVIYWQSLSVYPVMVVRNGQWVPHDPDWFNHTTLTLVSYRWVAKLTREVKTEKYELGPSIEEMTEGAAWKKKTSD